MNYYIAYGSNLYSEQFYQRCPDSVFVASGVLKDYTLAFCGINGNAFLTVKKQAGGSVPVAVCYDRSAICLSIRVIFPYLLNGVSGVGIPSRGSGRCNILSCNQFCSWA